MHGRWVLNVFLHKNGSSKLLSWYPRKTLLSAHLKIYPFVRSSSTTTQVLTAENVQEEKVSIFQAYFKNYLLSQPKYKGLVFDHENLNLETEGRPESVQLLKNLVSSPEDEENIRKLKFTLFEEKENLNFEEISKFFYLTYSCSISNKHSPLIEEIADIMIEELCNRHVSHSDAVKLTFSLYETWGRKKNVFFQRKMTFRYSENIRKLSPEEAVIFFYSILRFNEYQLKYIKFPINQYIIANISSFNAPELGIIARGLLRTTVYCGKELRNSFIKRTGELIESFNEIPLFYIFKMLHRYINKYNGHDLLDLQEKFIPHISKYDLNFLARFVLIGTNIGCLNVRLWEKIRNICKENINDLQLTTIERLVFALTQFDIKDEELLKLAIERFENASDLDSNYITLILFVNHLVHLQVYSRKLFDVAFGEDCTSYVTSGNAHMFLKSAYYETLILLGIDKPEVNFKSLSEKEMTKVTKINKFYTNCRPLNLLSLKKNLFTMEKILNTLYGGDSDILYCELNPVKRAGVIMRFDRNLKATPIPISLKCHFLYPPKPLQDDHIWVYICMLSEFFTFFESEKPKACVQTYFRHLKELGYNVIVVDEYNFMLQKKQKTANEFIQNLINNHLLKFSQQGSN